MDDLAQQAISYALKSDWTAAKNTNLSILKNNKSDISALNRLAKAYSELGETQKAIAIAKKVLALEPYNKIALKSLEKWNVVKKGKIVPSGPFSAKGFIEEPGKTKIIGLMHLGDPKLLASLDCGDEVDIDTHAHRATIVTQDGKHIGRLPDDLSLRLKKLITYGNKYMVSIKSIEKNDVKIFIKELEKAPKVKNISSFTTEKIDYIAFTPPELIHSSKIEHGVDEEDD